MSESRRARSRLIVFLGTVGLGAAIAFTIGLIAQMRAADSARARELQTLVELRRSAIGGLLGTMRSEVVLWSSDSGVQAFSRDLASAWGRGDREKDGVRARYVDDNPFGTGQRARLDDAGDGSVYSGIHAAVHPRVLTFLEQHDYDDVYIVDRDGELVYSVHKDADFGTNLRTGPYADTGLGRVVAAALQAETRDLIAFADFERYGPIGDRPASFIASPAIDESGALVGALAFQVPAERVGEILQFTEGMGQTGETYLVGSDHLMRSDSRFSDESTILTQRIDSESVARALMGESGVDRIEDYRGVEVISAYRGLQFEGVNWAVIAEQDRAEVRARVLRRPNILALLLLSLGSVGALLSLVFMWFASQDSRPTAWTED